MASDVEEQRVVVVKSPSVFPYNSSHDDNVAKLANVNDGVILIESMFLKYNLSQGYKLPGNVHIIEHHPDLSKQAQAIKEALAIYGVSVQHHRMGDSYPPMVLYGALMTHKEEVTVHLINTKNEYENTTLDKCPSKKDKKTAWEL